MKNSKKKIWKRYLFLGFSFIILAWAIFNKEYYGDVLQIKDLIFNIKINNWFTVSSPGIYIDKEQKQFELIYELKRVTNAKFANKASDIRRDVEKFLNKNKNYFLNDNYEIKLTFKIINYAQSVRFTNINMYDETCYINNKFRNVYVSADCPLSQLVNYYDMELILLGRFNDGFEILKNFNDLKYIAHFNGTFTEEEVEQIKENQPNCEVIDYSSEPFFHWNPK